MLNCLGCFEIGVPLPYLKTPESHTHERGKIELYVLWGKSRLFLTIIRKKSIEISVRVLATRINDSGSGDFLLLCIYRARNPGQKQV